MKDLLKLRTEVNGEYGNLKLICEDIETGNTVIFKQYFKNKPLSYVVNRWEPSEIIYDTMSYYVVDYTKVYRLGTDELCNGEELEKIQEFIDNILYTHAQFGFIGMLGLKEPKRI